MTKRTIDIPLDGVGENNRPSRRTIDIPLDGGKGADGINDKEYEFVNRHHEEYKELRRRAREQGGY
ncbi:hypothetical protein [uncultured Subdoligranulum sp.]|uniref:hypothetical protein n=1 Tax=uncultured Subdoligranulum sp. TaxID=512298 RepID=UPI0025E99A59|nr:hypothetical protein [uncultured Subdoligranulum sp.]